MFSDYKSLNPPTKKKKKKSKVTPNIKLTQKKPKKQRSLCVIDY